MATLQSGNDLQWWKRSVTNCCQSTSHETQAVHSSLKNFAGKDVNFNFVRVDDLNFESKWWHANIHEQKISHMSSFYVVNRWYRGPLYLHGLTLFPAWIRNYIHYNVWDEIIFPIPNVSHFTRLVITYPSKIWKKPHRCTKPLEVCSGRKKSVV